MDTDRSGHSIKKIKANPKKNLNFAQPCLNQTDKILTSTWAIHAFKWFLYNLIRALQINI